MTSLPPSDYLVDRRQLRRKLSFWRVAAILFLIIALIVAGTRLLGPNATAKFTPHIARLSISGLITGDRPTLTLIHDIGEAKSVSAVLVSINSPGGTTTGAEQLYDALRKLSAKKPTVAVVGTLAASGAISRRSEPTRSSRAAIRSSGRSASSSNIRMSQNCSTRSASKSKPSNPRRSRLRPTATRRRALKPVQRSLLSSTTVSNGLRGSLKKDAK